MSFYSNLKKYCIRGSIKDTAIFSYTNLISAYNFIVIYHGPCEQILQAI